MHIHGVVGVVLLLSSALALSETLERSSAVRVRLRSPTAISVGGFVVLLYVGFNHVAHDRAAGELVDAAHWIIGLSLVVAGLVVGLGRLRHPTHSLHEAAGPGANIVVGALFLVHGGTSPGELVLHVCISAALVLSALAQLAVVLTSEEARSLRVFSSLLVAVGGRLLNMSATTQTVPVPHQLERHFEPR